MSENGKAQPESMSTRPDEERDEQGSPKESSDQGLGPTDGERPAEDEEVVTSELGPSPDAGPKVDMPESGIEEPAPKSPDDETGEEVVVIEEGGAEAGGGEQAPTSGAGEGLIRALSELKEVKSRLEEAESRAKSTEDRLLRLGAEFDNFKKRALREKEEDRKFANERIIKELLPVVDNLERALEAACDASEDQLRSGVQMIVQQMLDTLKKFGVTQFSAEKEPFNPELHEAMQQVETLDVPPGTVVTEHLKGYLLNERLLRPAMVVVAKAPEVREVGIEEEGDNQEAGNDQKASATGMNGAGIGEEES